MPDFTLPSGSTIAVAAKDIARCRPSFSWENAGHIGSTLFKPRLIVMEPISVVGPALRAEHPSFVCLTGINGLSLWFDAKQARDAETPRASESGNGVQAIVPVGGIRMRVTDSVAAAQATIDAGRAA